MPVESAAASTNAASDVSGSLMVIASNGVRFARVANRGAR
jgi:hypothetical protein